MPTLAFFFLVLFIDDNRDLLFNHSFPSGYGFAARPVVGGHFALLALNDAPTDARSLKASGGKKKEKETRRLVGTRFRA